MQAAPAQFKIVANVVEYGPTDAETDKESYVPIKSVVAVKTKPVHLPSVALEDQSSNAPIKQQEAKKSANTEQQPTANQSPEPKQKSSEKQTLKTSQSE